MSGKKRAGRGGSSGGSGSRQIASSRPLTGPIQDAVLRKEVTIDRAFHIIPGSAGTLDMYYQSGIWVNTRTFFSFNVGQLPGIGNMLAEFDQFRIEELAVTFYPNQTVVDSAVTAATTSGIGKIPKLLVAIDLDSDNSAIPTQDQLLQYRTLDIVQLNRPHTVRWAPRINEAVFYNGITSGYKIADKPSWIDCNSAATPHYGLVWFVDDGAASSIPGYQLDSSWVCEVYVSARVSFRGTI